MTISELKEVLAIDNEAIAVGRKVGRREEAARWRKFVGEIVEVLDLNGSHTAATEFTNVADSMVRDLE